MAAVPELKNSVIDLNILRENEKTDFEHIFSTIGGSKCCIFEFNVYQFFNRIVDPKKFYPENGCGEIMTINMADIDTTAENVLFFIRPVIKNTKLVCNIIKKLNESNKNQKFFLYFLPQKTYVCNQILKSENVYQLLTVDELKIDLLPLDDDIVSMEFNDAFKNIYLDNNPLELEHIARALLKIQSLYGVIPTISSFGGKCSTITNIMQRLRNTIVDSDLPGEIDQCILIDRSIDFPSSLITPLTYEGLIDDTFEIKSSQVTVKNSIIGKPETAENDSTTMILNNNDNLFVDLRDNNIIVLPKVLKQLTMEIQAKINNKPTNTADISAIQDFIKQLPKYIQSQDKLPVYYAIMENLLTLINSYSFKQNWQMERSCLEQENIYDYIMDRIALQDPLTTVLRLLCLYSLVNDGIKQKLYEPIKREIIQTYGFEQMCTLYTLENMGFLKVKEGSSTWATLAGKLKCIRNDIDGSTMTDMNYVTSGYAPLSCRLISAAIFNPNMIKQDLQKYLTNPYIEIKQEIKSKKNAERKVVLLVFVGGITYTEIAALRQIKKIPNNKVDLLIMTTNILNGKRVIQSCLEKI